MVLGLAAAGARVIATAARETAEVEAIVAESLSGGNVVPMIADVASDEDCARVVEMAHDRFGRLDILLNNTGHGMKYVSKRFLRESARFWETDPDVWRMVIDSNVNGPFLMARAAVSGPDHP